MKKTKLKYIFLCFCLILNSNTNACLSQKNKKKKEFSETKKQILCFGAGLALSGLGYCGFNLFKNKRNKNKLDLFKKNNIKELTEVWKKIVKEKTPEINLESKESYCSDVILKKIVDFYEVEYEIERLEELFESKVGLEEILFLRPEKHLILNCFSSETDLLYYESQRSNRKIEFVRYLLKNGADPNCIYFNSTIFGLFIVNISFELAKYFFEHGANPNIKDKYGYTPFHILCLKHNLSMDLIECFLENGANPNIKNKYADTPFHALAKNENLSMGFIECFLKNGANLEVKNIFGDTPLVWIKRNLRNSIKGVEDLIESVPYLQNDLLKILDEKVLTDCEVESSDSFKFKVHKIWLETRLEKKIDEIKKILKEFSKDDVESFLSWVYTGILPEDENLKKGFIEKFKKFDINILQKSGRPGIVRDLKKLHEDEKSKDFSILVGKEKIKVHKFILVTFSDLYKNMFLSINENINQIKDYSGKSFEAMQTLIDFLYKDEIKEDLNKKNLEEVADLADYYQLNENSMLNYYLKKQGIAEL